MLWVDDQINIPNNFFSALVQLKFRERRLGKDPNLEKQYSTTISDDFSEGYTVEVQKST